MQQTLSPDESDVFTTSSEVTVTVSVTDDTNPVEGGTVRFVVQGEPGQGDGSLTDATATDAEGLARLTYRNSTGAGRDTITATFVDGDDDETDDLSDSVTIEFAASPP